MPGNPYLLPSGPQIGESRLSRLERRMGGLMQDSRVASSQFSELPESASMLGLRKAGQWYLAGAHNMDVGTSAVALTYNRLYVVPLYVPDYPNIMDGISIYVSTLKTNGSIRLGVYEDSRISPTKLIADFGMVSTTTIGAKAISTPRTTLARGVKWLALVCNSTGSGVVITHLNSRFWHLLGTVVGSAGVGYGTMYTAFTYAALPAHLGGKTWTKQESPPAIWVKFSETPKGGT